MTGTTTDSVSAEVLIVNKRGLHARASAKFVTCVSGMDGARVSVINKDGQEAAGGSILSLMMLGAAKGENVTISVSGTDREARLAELVAMIETGFGED
jgi:phosphocarrier protein HPr